MKPVFALLAGAAYLAACETAPVYNPVLPYDASLHSATSIGILPGALPERAVGIDVPYDYQTAINANMDAAYATGASPGAAAAGGIIGSLIVAAIDATIDANRNNRINGFLEEKDFDAEGIFHSALVSAFEMRGLNMSMMGGNEVSEGDDNDLDTHLIVQMGHYGYRLIGNRWLPSMTANISLVSADGQTVLLDDSVALGAPPIPLPPAAAAEIGPLGSDYVILPYNPMYSFKNIGEVVEDNPELGVAALEFALVQAANGIADLVIREASLSTADTPTEIMEQ